MLHNPLHLKTMRATMVAALLATASLAHADTGTVPVAAPTGEAVAPAQGQVRALFGAHRAGSSLLWITDGTRAGTSVLPLGRNVGAPP